MNLRQSPYAQIALVCLRGLNLQDSRWLYFALASMAVISIVGGGIALEWGVAALLKTAVGAGVFALQIAWVGLSAVLLRLNHPVASRLVPGYVGALRRSALALWLGICFLTGLVGILDGFSPGWFAFHVCGAGVFMLLIGTPMRWPVRWCFAVLGLAWLARHGGVIVTWEPLRALFASGQGRLLAAMLLLVAMAWVVTRMIAARGSSYASVFSRFLGMQPSDHVVNRDILLKVRHFSPWLKAYLQVAHWAVLPWQRYARHLLANPRPGPAHALARAELGFGPSVHWVTQVGFSVGFAMLVGLVWWRYPAFMGEGGGLASPLATFYLGLISVACAATSVLGIGSVMLLQQGEQKLMLLLPGVPQGASLNRLLALRHLRLAASAWCLSTAWALVLPYPDSVAHYVAAFCWGTLPLVPWVVQDWASVRPPAAGRATFKLVLAMLVPFSAWAALRWLQAPVELIAAIAVMSCLAVLRMRLSRLAHFPQAFPAGRLA